MSKVKAWRVGAEGEPTFPEDFEVVKKAVLQVTDIKSNHNKYYAIELHVPSSAASFRVFTHYGRTDDLETNPNAGAKETRYFDDRASAEACYQSIFNEKTNARKGYKEVSLASSKIGSSRARGTSSGRIDEKTLERIEGEQERRANRPASALSLEVQDLTRYVYEEATSALTTTVAAKITAHGIETPLGVLTLGQIEAGEAVLGSLFELFSDTTKKMKKGTRESELERLSGEFYTCVPHRVGRTRAAIEASVIQTLADFQQKQDTLQLMKDMLQVNGDSGNVLYDDEVDAKYRALGCEVVHLPESSPAFGVVRDLVVDSQVKTKNVRVKRVFQVKRASEHAAFRTDIGNERLLFHGSRIQNWVGLLSRGILMPKIVVSMGVHRTDAGWLGHGMYFGDASCTSAFYTTPGKRGTRFMAVVRVALGKQQKFEKITYGLSEPAAGYDSCHGVRSKPGATTQFADDEYVVYSPDRQRIEYIVEFTV